MVGKPLEIISIVAPDADTQDTKHLGI